MVESSMPAEAVVIAALIWKLCPVLATSIAAFNS